MKPHNLPRNDRVSFEALLENRIIRVVLLLLLFVISISPYLYAILFNPISCDASYYLSVVERIREAKKPYQDFVLGYTPLFFYVIAKIKDLCCIGINFTFDLSIHLLFLISSSIAIFKISELITKRSIFAYLTVTLYLLLTSWFVRYDFLLEIPSMSWGLWALYLALRYPTKVLLYVLIGFLCALSFLTKQYGLGFYFLILYLLLFDKSGLKHWLYFTIGFVGSLSLAMIVFPHIYSVFFGNGYGLENRSYDIATIQAILLQVKASIIFIFLRILVLIPAIALFPIIPKSHRKEGGLLLLGIFGFMLQFIFGPFMHYSLYIIPFIAIYLFFVLSKFTSNSLIYKALGFCLMLTFVLAIYKNYSRIFSDNYDNRAHQFLLANKIKKHIVPGNTLYIADTRLVEFYYILNVNSPNLDYSFGTALNEKTHFKQLNDADYILSFDAPDLYDTILNSERVMNYNRKLPNKIVLDVQQNYHPSLHKMYTEKVVLYLKE